MKINIKNFYIQILLLTVALFIIILIMWLAIPKFFIPAHFLTVAIFGITTILFYLLIKKNLESEKTMNFVNIFMATTIAKMFALMIYIVIYIFTVKENLVEFLSFVLINYFVFSFFEVNFLIKSQKNKN